MAEDKKKPEGGLAIALAFVGAAALLWGSWKVMKAVDKLLEKDLHPEDFKKDEKK